MNSNTKAEYLKLAAHFYSTRLKGKSPTPKRICDALKAVATDYRPAYWRRLRKALEVDQRDLGFDKAADAIASTQNPLTSDPSRKAEIKPKQLRVKQVPESDETALIDYLVTHKEVEVYAAVILTKYLGCRPAELDSLQFNETGSVLITGVKKRADRGLDRQLYIDDPAVFRHLMRMHQRLVQANRADPVRYAQKRLAILTQRLWPQRKARPSLYSFRHQMGADLKASERPDKEVAAIMGHRSTESISVYGNRALSRDSRAYLHVAQRAVQQVLTKPVKLPPSQVPATQCKPTFKNSSTSPRH
jgi:integrase